MSPCGHGADSVQACDQGAAAGLTAIDVCSSFALAELVSRPRQPDGRTSKARESWPVAFRCYRQVHYARALRVNQAARKSPRLVNLVSRGITNIVRLLERSLKDYVTSRRGSHSERRFASLALRRLEARAQIPDARTHGWQVAAVSAGVIAVSVAVRLPEALSRPLWQDEVASARVIAQPSLRAVVDQVSRHESTPPGWYVMAWAIHQAGVGMEDLRLFSVVVSSIVAGLVVIYAQRFLSLAASTFAGALTALGWQFVAHGRELRAYALYSLLSLAFAMALGDARDKPTRWRLVALASVVALGLVTHHFFGFVLLAGLAWVWLTPTGRSARRRTTLACILGVLPLIALLPLLVEQFRLQHFDWIGGFSVTKTIYVYGTFLDYSGALYADASRPFGLREIAWLGVTALVVAGAAWLARQSSQARLSAFLATGPVALAATAWLAGLDLFNTRNLLGVGPFAAVAIAAIVFALPFARVLALALTVAAVTGTIAAPPLGHRGDHAAKALVDLGWASDDPIVLIGGLNYGFRSAMAWYLPNQPRLTRTSCPTSEQRIHVVSPKGDFILPRRRVGRVERVDGDLVVAEVDSGALERLDRRKLCLKVASGSSSGRA
jgi:hypothetical protein